MISTLEENDLALLSVDQLGSAYRDGSASPVDVMTRRQSVIRTQRGM